MYSRLHSAAAWTLLTPSAPPWKYEFASVIRHLRPDRLDVRLEGGLVRALGLVGVGLVADLEGDQATAQSLARVLRLAGGVGRGVGFQVDSVDRFPAGRPQELRQLRDVGRR